MFAFDPNTNERICIILMGVSGCGKTTIGESLSNGTSFLTIPIYLELKCTFLDGDHLHPHHNKIKMQNGYILHEKFNLQW